MRIHTKIKKLTNDDLRSLSTKTGKSVRVLKRLRETKYYLIYTSESDSYAFLGYTSYLSLHPDKSLEEFFETIQEHQLSQML